VADKTPIPVNEGGEEVNTDTSGDADSVAITPTGDSDEEIPPKEEASTTATKLPE
jgi:hypothetical protein